MSLLHSRPVFLCLAVTLLAACGGEKPPPADPTLIVSLAGPAKVYCTSTPVTLQATLVEGTPDSVELLRDGEPVAQLTPPYQYSFDCPNEQERTYEFIVEAKLQERAFRSAPKQIVVDRTRPLVTGPFAGETEIRKDAPIRLTFSEPMKTTPVTPASITLTDSTRVTLSWSQDQKVLTVTPEAPIRAPKTLTLSVRAADFQDLAGNPLAAPAPAQWEWTVPAVLTEWTLPKLADGTFDRAALALDRSGRAVVAWPASSNSGGVVDVYVARADASGTTQLGGPLRAQPDQNTFVSDIAVAVDASNRPVVAWLEPVSTEKRVFVRRWNGSSWEELGSVPNPSAGRNASDLVLATGDSDLPVLAWQEPDASLTFRVYVYRWNGTEWAPVGAPLEARGGTANLGYPSLVVDKQSRPMVAVSELSSDPAVIETVLVLRWSGATWEQIGVGLRPLDAPAGAIVTRSSLALDPQGQPAVAFELVTSGATSSSDDLYLARNGSGGWSSVQYLGGANLIKPSLAFDAQGELWGTWENTYDSNPRKVWLQRLSGQPLSAILENVSEPVFANGGVGAPALLLVDNVAHVARVVRPQ